MFLNQNDLGPEDIIQFEEQEPSNRSPNRHESRRTSQLKQPMENQANQPNRLLKNDTYIKQLGQNDAAYYGEKPIDLKLVKVEDQPMPPQQQQQQQKLNQVDCESVIQFPDYADDGSKPMSLVQIEDDQDNQSAQIDNRSQSPGKSMISGASPDKSQIQNHSHVSAYPLVNQELVMECSKPFLYAPMPNAGIVQCKLLVNDSGLNVFSTKFYLMKDNKFLLAAKKSSHKYLISMDKDHIDQKHITFMGQISRKGKTVYNFYDTGANPKRKQNKTLRNSLGQLNFIVTKKPNEPRQQKFMFPNDSDEFMNRAPKWNVKSKSFTLNFYDRVKMPSIKNFQLTKCNEQPEQIYVQLGKVNAHEYNLDFQCPFSPLQAFMIALANYDKKIEY